MFPVWDDGSYTYKTSDKIVLYPKTTVFENRTMTALELNNHMKFLEFVVRLISFTDDVNRTRRTDKVLF